ncbi:MAG TPA: slipin family protein [Thermoanaerobaculia bacterium]|jgi:regulator of protease activity HflC (stomatin/prohibitin superfamily)|nr:slipin family protein [Thermoanaerobaculia bacterium]
MFRRLKINAHERGLLFREREFLGVLSPGVYWRFDPFLKLRLQTVDPRNPWIVHNELDLIVKSGRLGDEAAVVDLKDHERALVWIDGRFASVLNAGLYAYWTTERTVRVETIDARAMKLVHVELPVIVRSPGATALLEVLNVEPGHVGLWFRDGLYQETLGPGTYAFWKSVGTLKLYDADLRELALDISGQEIMTADKVTLRVNALVTYRIADPLRSVSEVDDAAQALYRAAQLALREAIGAKDLDALLVTKEVLGRELAETIRPRAAELGYAIVSAGVRDVILPGDMKDLMNKVTEAKKAAEASLITRREETAAMRMQANTAKILESSPTLMKLRELETLERVAGKANLTVVLGGNGLEEGLANRVIKLL